MRPNFISIYFKVDSDNGFKVVEGLAKFSPAGIVLEFESKILGFIKSEVEYLQIPLREIEAIKLKKRWWRHVLEIRLNSYQPLSKIPNKNGIIKMVVARDYRERAEEAVKLLEEHLAEQQNLPTQPEARSLFENEATTKDLENKLK